MNEMSLRDLIEELKDYEFREIIASCSGPCGRKRMTCVVKPARNSMYFELFLGSTLISRAQKFDKALEIYNTL